jgi:hypothetical protein
MSHGDIDTDPGWAALNPPEFRYGGGGRAALSDPNVAWDRPAPTPGFVSRYSTTGLEEDKAELFAFLVAHPRKLAERAGSDAVLRAKVERMKAQLTAFCPAVDDQFWQRVKQNYRGSE